MDGGIGIASGLAGLITISAQLTKLIHAYIKDVRHASSTQKAYLSEVSALTDVLLRFENVWQDDRTRHYVDTPRPSADIVRQCQGKLTHQHAKLQKHFNRFIWPFEAPELRKAIDELQRFREVFASYVAASTSSLTAATLIGVESLKLEQNRASLLEALHHGEFVFRARPEALTGTGTWLLEHTICETWLTSTPSSLWCYGAPGVGKSSMASVVIENLSKRQSRESCYVLYHFCNFASRKQETELAILQDLLCQIAEQGDDNVISNLHQRRHSILSPSCTANDVARLFTQLCLRVPVYLIIDGLDEVENVKKVVSRLLLLVNIGFRVLITSRDHPDIRAAFDQTSSIELYAKNEDIKTYICDRFQESDFADVLDESHSLVDDIIDRSNGLFILAKLLMDQMLTCTHIKQMRKSLSSAPSTVADAYQSSLERIKALKAPSRDLALRLISWIVHAERAFHPEEVIHAFALDDGEEEIDEESLTRLPTLLRNCAGLVVLDSELNSLGLVHTTAYEYFTADEKNTKHAHYDIASTSLHYLNLKTFRNEKCSNPKQIDQRLQELPFLRYAARHWGRHVLKSEAEAELYALICMVLKNDTVGSNAFVALYYHDALKDRGLATAVYSNIPDGHSGLHFAAYWGLICSTNQLLKEGMDPNARNSQKWCPLHWAAHNGHVAICQILLDNNASPNVQDDRGWTPLFWSSFYGNVRNSKLLLERGSDYMIKDSNGWTALHWAVCREEVEAVKLILSYHARENPSQALSRVHERKGESMDSLASEKLLEIAANENNSDIFEILLNAHLDTDDPDFNALWATGRFDPPLGDLWRTLNKAERIHGVEGYLRNAARPVDADQSISKDKWKGRLLHSAIKDDQLSGLRLLLELGADPNHKMLRLPLHAAALRQNSQYTRLLLQFGADVKLTDRYGQTALHQAVLCGFDDTVKALIEGGANVNCRKEDSRKDDDEVNTGKTPLMLACCLPSKNEMTIQSRSKIVDYLIAANADTNLLDAANRSALHYAIENCNLDIAQKLLRQGADVLSRDEEGVSAMHLAAKSCDVRLVELLIAAGANTSGEDDLGRSCFHFLAAGHDRAHDIENLRKLFSLISSDSECARFNTLVSQATPLSVAIANRNWKISQIMMEAGASLPPFTPRLLESPVKSLHVPVICYILDYGATSSDWSLSSSERTESDVISWLWSALGSETVDPESLDQVIKKLQPLTPKGLNGKYCGDTLLHQAGRRSNADKVMAVLLQYGCDPFLTNSEGIDVFLNAVIREQTLALRQLLQDASSFPPENHWLNCFEDRSDPSDPGTDVLLCAYKALRANGQLNKPLSNGRTLLREAIELDSIRLAQTLIDLGADPTISDEYGWNLLHHAVHQSRTDIIDKILSSHESLAHTSTTKWATYNGPRPSGLYPGDDWTGTALHLAVMAQQPDVVRKLLNLGVDVNVRTTQGMTMTTSHGPTALYIALTKNEIYGVRKGALSEDSLSIARMLLERGAQVGRVGELLNPIDKKKFILFEDVWDRLKGIRST